MTIIAHSRSRVAFTLIEMLAVVFLMSVIVGTAAVGLANVHGAAEALGVLGSIREMDERARLAAQTDAGSVEMTIDQERNAIAVRRPTKEETICETRLRRGASIEFIVEARSLQAIRFDRLGRSQDYAIVFHDETRLIRWNVAGLTGWMVREDVQ